MPERRDHADDSGARRLLRTLVDLCVRLYALALTLALGLAAAAVLYYLFHDLLAPYHPPEQIAALPRRIGLRELATGPQRFEAIRRSELARSPLSHFHRITGWPRPDRANDCTRSGCHTPLPHGQHKQVRAFLNMHATALHCSVCHLTSDRKPLLLVWYDPQTGRPAEPPALLRAYAWLTSARVRDAKHFTEDEQRRIVKLLRQASAGVGGEPVLEELARHLAAVRPDSEQFRSLLETTRSELPHHFRAEYDTKLALAGPDGQPVLGFPGRTRLIESLIARRAAGQEPDAQQVKALHEGLRQPTLHCTDCHRADGSLVDLAALGYPPARIRHLRQAMIFRMIEDIAAGQPFHLPAFLSPMASQPATQP